MLLWWVSVIHQSNDMFPPQLMSKEIMAPFGTELSGDLEQQVSVTITETNWENFLWVLLCCEILFTRWIWRYSLDVQFVLYENKQNRKRSNLLWSPHKASFMVVPEYLCICFVLFLLAYRTVIVSPWHKRYWGDTQKNVLYKYYSIINRFSINYLNNNTLDRSDWLSANVIGLPYYSCSLNALNGRTGIFRSEWGFRLQCNTQSQLKFLFRGVN